MRPQDDSSKLDAILDQALDLPQAQRAAFLDDVCRNQPTLRKRVEQILAAADREDLVDRPIAEVAADLLADSEPESSLVGLQVGPYRVVRELGRGGMGAVYLAERDEGDFSQNVAIKLVRSASSPQHLLDRFVVERQILARLEHPHVARLYDGGLTDDGEPYFVMEYIDGQPIDVYADEHKLSIESRLVLFDQVCDAVQYAHRNLVVHRDLKPSNILVTRDGEAKLLDFGVAKLLAEEGSEALTQPGSTVLTPEYASPEQVEGRPVSTASDVYSLGALLYELLTGARPFQFDSRSPAEIARTVLETQPTRPSALFEQSDDEATASRRDTTSARLRRQLHGDLDTIVLMALRKEPERRYASVAQLRDDLRRHRNGLPVAARRSTFRYRTQKLLARHRAASALVVLVALSLVGGLIATAWQARVAAREARTAERVTQFLTELFRASDPDAAAGVELTARSLLDEGVERLTRGELSEEPHTRAELLTVVGSLYHVLGNYDEAQPLVEEALATRRGLHAEDHPKVLEGRGLLARVLYSRGEFAKAEQEERLVLATRQRTLPADSPEVASSLINLAAILTAQGRYEECEPLYQEALKIDRRRDSKPDVAADLSNYGQFLADAGRYEDSRAALEEALMIRTELLGPVHTDVATTKMNLGSTLIRLGEFAGAQRVLEEAVNVRLELLGDRHPHTAFALNELAEVVRMQGGLEEARRTHLRALDIRRNVFGEEHAETAGSLNNLGLVSYYLNDYAEAEGYFRRALGVFRSQLGEDHPHTMTAVNNVAAVLREQGKMEEAEQLFRDNLARRRELLGEQHPAVNEAMGNLAWLLLKRAKFAEARPLFEASLARHVEIYQSDHIQIAEDHQGLGRTLLELGHPDQAEHSLAESARIRAAKLDADNLRTADARMWLGRCLSELKRHDEALALLEENVPRLAEAHGYDYPSVAKAQRALEASLAATAN